MLFGLLKLLGFLLFLGIMLPILFIGAAILVGANP